MTRSINLLLSALLATMLVITTCAARKIPKAGNSTNPQEGLGNTSLKLLGSNARSSIRIRGEMRKCDQQGVICVAIHFWISCLAQWVSGLIMHMPI